MITKSKIILTTPSISIHDAVSNDVWQMQASLNRAGYDCRVYAEIFSESLRNRLISLDEAYAIVKSASAIWIYHHSVYWPQGNHMLAVARAKVILRYHNITPSQYFEEYGDSIAGIATRKGIEQTLRLIHSGMINAFWGASKFNCDELVAYGADSKRCYSLAPLHLGNDFKDAGIDQTISVHLKQKEFNILFVGRTVANKGHLHLLKVLDSYLTLFGTSIYFNIVGNLDCAPLQYLNLIKKTIAELRLGSHVKFWGSTSFNALHTFYSQSDVFLSMSEHEGFCVPVFEAQIHNLPVVALDRTAVVETQGKNQINFQDLNYKNFAASLYYLKHNPKARAYLIEEGRQNCLRFDMPTLERTLLELVGYL